MHNNKVTDIPDYRQEILPRPQKSVHKGYLKPDLWATVYESSSAPLKSALKLEA